MIKINRITRAYYGYYYNFITFIIEFMKDKDVQVILDDYDTFRNVFGCISMDLDDEI
jgi:hypothetical protein